MSSSVSGPLSETEGRRPISGAAVPVDVGEVLAGKYRVDKILGIGAMGVVVAATHVDLQEVRALKFMLPTMLGNAEGVERFLREARAAVKLRSPHVAKVFDVGRLDSGAPYIVMEYLEGADLKTILEQRRFLPTGEAVRYLLDACEALAEAHAAGIIHRDLKPANMFVARGPKGEPCLKVLDFGIAKMAPPPGSDAALEMTRTAEILGTPLYMAPEQMRSMRNADARTDIWSLGVILYRALAGRRPFKGQSITEVCATVIADAPPPLGETRADLPPGLEAVVLRCLEKDPAKRFQKVSELAAALAPFAPHEEETMTLTEVDELREPSLEGDGATHPPKTPPSTTLRDLGTARAAAWSQAEASGSVPATSSRGRWFAGAAVVLVGLGVAIGLGLGARPGTSGEALHASSGAVEASAAPSATIAPALSATTIAEAAPSAAMASAAAATSASPASSASASPKASAAAHPPPGPAAAPRKATPAKDAFGDDRK